ncbi:MAG: hypothetical protein RR959_08670 [Erysipelotrichaceae bacterium]
MKYPIGTKVRVVKVPEGLDEDDTPIGSIGEIVEYGREMDYKVKSEGFKDDWWWFMNGDVEPLFNKREYILLEIEETKQYLNTLQLQLDEFK